MSRERDTAALGWRSVGGSIAVLIAIQLLASVAASAQALAAVRLFDDGEAHGRAPARDDPARIFRAWPFCPTDRIPCAEDGLAWVELELSLDVYSARRNDPHDSVERLLELTRRDFAPLVSALEDLFRERKITSDRARVAFVHGLVQGVVYELDTSTGWTEYPKFGIELFVDEQGDCDDAAVATGTLLDELGYETFFVRWRGPDIGHLSTAVTPRRGDLGAHRLPAGSRWIVGPDGQRLLHVDATGVPGGCGRAWVNCAELGTNLWHEEGLSVVSVARVDDPRLAAKLPLRAWSNGGFRRPDRTFVDRRTASDRAIRGELEQRDGEELLRRRVATFGIEDERARRYLARQRIGTLTFVGYLAACLGTATFFVTWQVRAHLKRKRNAAARRDRKRREAF